MAEPGDIIPIMVRGVKVGAVTCVRTGMRAEGIDDLWAAADASGRHLFWCDTFIDAEAAVLARHFAPGPG